MNIVPGIIYLTFVCAFLAEESYSIGVTLVGDILIETQSNGLIYCDSMICPKGSSNCQVTKRNDPNDFMTIIRHRKCLASNGDILQEEKIKEQNKLFNIVNINVSSGGGVFNSGRPMTPEERKELGEFLQQTEQRVQTEVGGALNQVYTSLGPLLDGTFSKKLQNEISSSFQNEFDF